MIKFLDILYEAKQVGDIYHFTSIQSLHNMINSSPNSNGIVLDPTYTDWEDNNGYYSFTRNPNMSTLSTDKQQVRLKINGDKMSNRYKFEPHADIAGGYGKIHSNPESEERVSSDKYGEIDLAPYVEGLSMISLDNLLDYPGTSKQEIEKSYDFLEKWFKNKGIPVDYINKKFKATSHRKSK